MHKVNESTAKTVCVWTYRCMKEIDDFRSADCLQYIYTSLVKKLQLEEHSRKVIAAYIQKGIKEKKLKINNNHDKRVHPYNFTGSLEVNFHEDGIIYDTCGDWPTETEENVNLVRAVFCGNDRIFLKIFENTFFVKPDSSEPQFKIPSKRAEIPADFLEACENTENVNMFAEAFKLEEIETLLLNFSYLSHLVRDMNRLCSYLMDEDFSIVDLYVICLGISQKEIRRNLTPDKKIISYGLFDNDGSINMDVLEAIYSRDIDSMFNDVLKKDSKKEIFKIDTFSIPKEETDLTVRLLKNDGAVNILLYGAPGAGKTEYARSLAKKCGLKPLIFKNELEVEDSPNAALYRLNSLLSLNKKDSVIIVDEAESVLATSSGNNFLSMLFGEDGNSSSKKGTVNTMLENSENKVIWILNYTKPLDESTLRRFTYSLEFREMTSNMLRMIAGTKLDRIEMSKNLHDRLVELCGKYQVTGASVDNIIKTLKGMDLSKDEESVIHDVTKVLEANSSLLYGKPKMREKIRSSYDLDVLNTSIPAKQLVKMVENAIQYSEENSLDPSESGIRMLFYGVSGTGKTELARYIADKTGKKILLKRASDILGQYVGQNEQHIKDAFREAEASGAILLFDEADSFFSSRTLAKTSWERTMVNEFLTQMEEFSGILICTTNLKKIMDSAMQRRFHIMCEFNPLEKNGIRKLLKRFFGKFEFSDLQVSSLEEFNSITPGDFGSLAGRIRFVDAEQISSEYIINELSEIQKEKNGNTPKRRVGFAC